MELVQELLASKSGPAKISSNMMLVCYAELIGGYPILE
jgi:hypothetical protein